MNRNQAPDIRSWRPASGREPVVRIGVVLDVDAMDRLVMEIPDEAYELRGKGSPARTLRKLRLEARAGDDAVLLRIEDAAFERAPFGASCRTPSNRWNAGRARWFATWSPVADSTGVSASTNG
jgi:hypothetical protein